MTVRPANALDAELLAEVHARAFDNAWSAPDIARLMQVLGGYAFIRLDEEGVTGFILARVMGGEAEILTLAVAPWARRRGAGLELVTAATAEAAARGADSIFLEVAADNQPALGLYLRLGFEQVGQRRAYYRRAESPAMDAMVLRRTLNTGPG